MSRNILWMALVTLGLLATATPATAAEALREDTGFSIEFATGVVGIDGLDETQAAVAVIPRWCRDVWRNWCIWIDIWWIDGPWPDPWRGVLLVNDVPVPVSSLDVGPGLMLAPAFEYRFQPQARLTPSLYFGAGVQFDEGATTNVAGVGDFRTESTTSPVAIFGGALTYDLNQRSALRFGLGGSVLFMGDMDITAPDGSIFNVDGDDNFSSVLSVGVDVRF